MIPFGSACFNNQTESDSPFLLDTVLAHILATHGAMSSLNLAFLGFPLTQTNFKRLMDIALHMPGQISCKILVFKVKMCGAGRT